MNFKLLIVFIYLDAFLFFSFWPFYFAKFSFSPLCSSHLFLNVTVSPLAIISAKRRIIKEGKRSSDSCPHMSYAMKIFHIIGI